MRRWMSSLLILISALGLGLGAIGYAQAKSLPTVSDIRVGQHGEGIRVVLDMDSAVAYQVFTLPEPYRVVVNLPELDWRVDPARLPQSKGLLAQLRYGLFAPGTSRMVIDASGPVKVLKVFQLKPVGGNRHRLVIDLGPTSETVFLEDLVAAKAARSAEPQVASAPRPITPTPVPVRPRGKRVVAVDAGHGGVDPGTIGYTKTYEKTITLAMARELKTALEKTGKYHVVLTRDRDIFLRLRDRVRKAREGGAELFISIHADSVANSKTRGLSVYTLSETASDKEAATLAAKENKADLIAGIDLSTENAEVTNILIDLAQRETMNQSAIIARDLVQALKREVKLLRNTHRFAGFAVLKAPDMPSVLVEAGFLSNPIDEKNLKKKSYRAKLVRAIVGGVGLYFSGIEQARLH